MIEYEFGWQHGSIVVKKLEFIDNMDNIVKNKKEIILKNSEKYPYSEFNTHIDDKGVCFIEKGSDIGDILEKEIRMVWNSVKYDEFTPFDSSIKKFWKDNLKYKRRKK